MSVQKYTEWIDKKRSTVNLKDMMAFLETNAHSIQYYRKGLRISGKNRHASYNYTLTENPINSVKNLKIPYTLKNGEIRYFQPKVHPAEMLHLGIFEGKMINDCLQEFPKEWFQKAIEQHKLSPSKANININYYKIKSRQSLKIWKSNGWIYGPDERGWFQWYCRYLLGRRIPDIDNIQMKRWKSIARWVGVLKKHPERIILCQLLLQWSWLSP